MHYKIYSLALLIVVLLLTIIEKKQEDSILTPFTVMAWPFVFISIVVNFLGIEIELLPVTGFVHLFLLQNIIIFWITGRIIGCLFGNNLKSWNETKKVLERKLDKYRKYELFLIVLCWILAIATIWRAKALFAQHGGITYIANQDYEKNMAQGIINFALNFAKVGTILLFFLYAKSNRKILIILTFIIMVIALALQHIKFNLLWIIFICFFFKNLFEPVKQQMKNIISISLTVFGILLLFWITLVLSWGNYGLQDKGMWRWVSKTFLTYLSSGPINLHEWLKLKHTAPDWGILLVFRNIVNIVKDNPHRFYVIECLTPGFLQINATGREMYSNTGTAFGVYYLIGGFYFTLLMNILTASISYFLYFLIRIKTNIMILFFVGLLLTISTLTFFSTYYTSIAFWIISGIMMIFFILFAFLNRYLFV